MFFQKYDQKTKKKLISQYQTIISSYTSENNQLLSKIEDLKTTLSINQNLLYHFISTKLGENENVKIIINKSKNLWKQNELLIDNKNNIEMKTDKLQKHMEQIPSQIREEVNNISVQINKKKNDLIQKDNVIKKLKLDLEKTRKSAFFKTARTEVLVTGPTKLNLEISQELLNTKNILSKVSNKHSKAKKRSDKMEKEVKNLRDEMAKLKQSSINLNNKINIKNIKKILESVNDEHIFLENMGYNITVENNDQEYEEEEKEESDESSEDNNCEENRKNKTTKDKEFKYLEEQYSKLKNQIEDYQKKISSYKETYKEYKIKIEKLKNENSIKEK